MIKAIYSTIKTSVFLFIITLFFSSCISQKEIKYFQPGIEKAANKSEFVMAEYEDYRFNYGDNAYINIRSLDEQSNAMFNPSAGNSQTFNNDAGIYLNSYTIDINGEIDFPLIGKVKLVGLTTQESIDKIQASVDVYLKETTVVVKLVNFNITLVGEVKNPGEYKIYQDKVTLFEAISLAGDLSEYGNRKKVKLIRLTNTGHQMVVLDLTRENILESPYFYLKPNDVLYVEPLRGKQFGFSTFPYTLLFTTISSVILIMNTIRN